METLGDLSITKLYWTTCKPYARKQRSCRVNWMQPHLILIIQAARTGGSEQFQIPDSSIPSAKSRFVARGSRTSAIRGLFTNSLVVHAANSTPQGEAKSM